MSAEEPGLSAASCCMETHILHGWPREAGDEEEVKDEEHYEETKEPQRCSSDESDESESEPPPASALRRKVSFADAFGLDLVSIKEFDCRAETGPNNLKRLMGVEGREGEEYYLSCLFTVPSSDEELSSLLQQNKLELESIELFPGSTTIRGIIRVLNLSYHKTIYVRTTLDGWQSHFDLLAEYMPGSSDGQTDRFTFNLTLVPPFQAEGAWVEFCLRYESSTGTFWNNNGGMNYVLFCRHRGGRDLRENEGEKEKETQENNNKGKKSCLKSSRKWSSADLKSKGTSRDLSEPESCRSEKSEEENIQHKAESCSSQSQEECSKTLVERRNRRRAARLARVQDYFSQRETEAQLEYHPHREATEGSLKVVMPVSQLSNPMGLDTSEVFQVHNKKDTDTPPILTYHQIPLLSLDWGKPKDSPSHPHTVEIRSEKGLDVPEKQLSDEKSTESPTDTWEAFLNGAGGSDTHANAVDQECLLRIASLPLHAECNTTIPEEKMPSGSWQDFGPSHTKEEALGYRHAGKPGITSEAHIVQEELVWDHPGSETQTSKDMPMLINRNMDTMESQNSKEGQGVTHEECKGNASSIAAEEEVKGDINEAALTTLTFTGITIRHMGTERPLERQCTSEEKEPKPMKEQINEDNENSTQMKAKTCWGEPPEDLTVRLVNGKQGENEEPFKLREQNTEMTDNESMVLDKEESDTMTECSDSEASRPEGKEEAMCHEPENERLMEMKEKILDDNVADGQSDMSSTAKLTAQKAPYEVDEAIVGRKSTSDTCKDFTTGKEPHRPHRVTDICTCAPTLSITSHASDTSGPFSWTESVRESESLLFSDPHKSFEFGETLRQMAVQDLNELQDPDAECPASPSKRTTPSVCTMSSRLMAWWAEFCSLGHISKALLYAILFVVFITAYLHDLPVCLAIYLLSMCWWCGHGMKKRVGTSGSVD